MSRLVRQDMRSMWASNKRIELAFMVRLLMEQQNITRDECFKGDHLEYLVGEMFQFPDEFEQFIYFHRDIIINDAHPLSFEEINRIDRILGLKPRVVSEFEYTVLETVHNEDPEKVTKKDLERLIIER